MLQLNRKFIFGYNATRRFLQFCGSRVDPLRKVFEIWCNLFNHIEGNRPNRPLAQLHPEYNHCCGQCRRKKNTLSPCVVEWFGFWSLLLFIISKSSTFNNDFSSDSSITEENMDMDSLGKAMDKWTFIASLIFVLLFNIFYWTFSTWISTFLILEWIDWFKIKYWPTTKVNNESDKIGFEKILKNHKYKSWKCKGVSIFSFWIIGTREYGLEQGTKTFW